MVITTGSGVFTVSAKVAVKPPAVAVVG